MRIKVVIFGLISLFLVSYVSFGQKNIGEQKSKANKALSRRYKTKEAKYEAAKNYYAKGSYLTASQLFEELYPLYLSLPEGDTILFLYADSYLKNNDYLMAAFHFRDYVRRYPQSERAEEARFLAAKAYYLNTPAYNLDQSDSHIAMEELEIFTNAYPQSPFVPQCNAMMDTLYNKLAHKDFNIAKMYHRTGNYESAAIAFENILRDFPGSNYIEETFFYLVKNSYLYARKSVIAKQVERYQSVIDNKNKLKAFNDKSKYLAEAEKLADEAQIKRNKILENKQ
ncbi:MAG: outer membrane protein assembly factor BamD [Bacteroidales bacterium]|jgi:outer membrane protein assembly factor BamD|nr:outer membrane protein assembly factor BamD [Bacteroidales bacterium]